MVIRILIIFFLNGVMGFISKAQVTEKVYPYIAENQALLLDERMEERVLFTCDSLFNLGEYKGVTTYVNKINSQLNLNFQIEKPLFQVRLLLRAIKAEARLGDVSGGYQLLKRAEQHLNSTKKVDSTLNQEIYGFLSSASRILGYYEEALRYSHIQLHLIDEKKNALEKAGVYNRLGLIHSRLFNKQLALKYFNICYRLREKVSPQWLPYVMNNIGVLYERTQEYDSALYWYNRAYDFKHADLREDNLIHSVLLYNMSKIYSAREQNKKALVAINESIRIRLINNKVINYAVFSMLKKVDILLNLGDLKTAEILLGSIKGSHVLGNEPDIENSFYMEKAKFKLLINEFDSTLFFMDKAIYSLDANFDRQNVTEFLKVYTPNYPDYILITTIEEKGNMYLGHFKITKDVTDLELAILYNQKAIEYMNTYIYRQPNIISDPEIYYHSQRLLGKQLNLLDQLQTIDSTRISSAELTKLFEADRMHSVKKNLIYNQLLMGNPNSEQLLKERERLNNLLMNDNTKDANAQKHDSTFNQLNELEIKLKSTMGNLYDLKIKETYLIPDDYLKDLPENVALVQYFFSDSTLHCLYATSKNFKWYKIDWNSKEKKLLKSALRMIRDPANHQYSYLEDLGRKLLPFLKSHKEKKLMIMPSGMLHHLPFESLLVDGNFLVKDYAISYLEALSWPINKKPKPTKKFSGFAPFVSSKPVPYDEESVSVFRNSNQLDRLTGSLVEIENASSYFNSEIFANNEATETQLKGNTNDLKVIHLATHGLMEDDNPLMNSIVLTADSLNDGLLHTYELFHLKLPAELAILSACNTGNGNYQQGEGMLSLATGFYTAGVQNLLFTLWSIPDQQSAELVSNFYKHWQDDNKTMAEALQEAKVDYLTHTDQMTKHPFFWAGFVMHQKEITKKETKILPFWLYSSGIFLFVILLIFIFYKLKQSKTTKISRA